MEGNGIHVYLSMSSCHALQPKIGPIFWTFWAFFSLHKYHGFLFLLYMELWKSVGAHEQQ